MTWEITPGDEMFPPRSEMTHTEELVAALAEGLRAVDITLLGHRTSRFNDAWYTRLAEAQVAAITPATRDKMLLGFAVAEWLDADEWRFISLSSMSSTDDVLALMTRDTGDARGSRHAGTAPTPLAAVEAAIKEVRGE